MSGKQKQTLTVFLVSGFETPERETKEKRQGEARVRRLGYCPSLLPYCSLRLPALCLVAILNANFTFPERDFLPVA